MALQSAARRVLSGQGVLGVRMVGDPVLHRISPEIDTRSSAVVDARRQLHEVLDAFRRSHGFGRAIAAPQIGCSMRMIALNLGKGPFTMHNPRFFNQSTETMSMWDDCMSFPSLLVRVRRHRNLGVRYENDAGEPVELPACGQALAELLQHEVDHLDGITSFDRMEGPGAVIHRDVYNAHKAEFDAAVDYSITPTL